MSWEMCFTICCSTFFQPTGRRRDRSRLLPRNPPKRQHPPRPPISQEMRNEQAECPLFSPNFPAELRLSIYEAVLGDQHRLMHVIPFDDQSNRVGRRRCIDTAFEGPTWQHKCFGTWLERETSSRRRDYTFYSCDRYLALVLSCHRIYLEAINVMYTANKFSVKGARGIEAFHSVTPQPQWHQIRHLNISTIFLTPRQYYPEHEWFPPDNYVQWPTSCAIVQSLHGLRSLQVELIVRDTHDRKNETLVEEEALFSILKPLTLVSAPLFEVEINMAVPETVLKKLGELTFTLVVKYKPYEHSLFSAL
ncbi:hypothetical protein HBH56_098890 [Parastagonospora nodorum]|uniref:DUF7730 domain-containing protein n=1 Tax=Phaeosphaeria nodorum (strain SN15 / ATCC MYA-4574 / FGSC 10173) TaxID=321614 RepID=A0A7U2NR82_PHANO|nr:hypothetical protein HBH56_098890 [Parastagonospora nodorum]QRD07408.1 hypothetical protein JI435_131980 [Parastagonospora nodorum SN15]KAH3930339.1 hypothetical protein HBH54_113210 [Parastagonospora nodorum]KAH4136262.1 hypothetical protein HBH45_137970 [Parastagonospora nodorum]KAH4158119.1 hypothetical protein HBH44_116930 [Parastagonospora nodorum]